LYSASAGTLRRRLESCYFARGKSFSFVSTCSDKLLRSQRNVTATSNVRQLRTAGSRQFALCRTTPAENRIIDNPNRLKMELCRQSATMPSCSHRVQSSLAYLTTLYSNEDCQRRGNLSPISAVD